MNWKSELALSIAIGVAIIAIAVEGAWKAALR